jgi:peptide/nickel transport system ATP-binding protein
MATTSSLPAKTASDTLLRVNGLSVGVQTAGGGVIEAVRDVSFELARGGTLGLVGESGSGKTLTCRAILGVLPAGVSVSGGSVQLGEVDLLELDRAGWRQVHGTRVAAVFQDPGSYLNPSIAVGEQIAEVLRVRGGRGRHEARERAVELLELMRMRNPRRVYGQYPAELSGGMLQRLLIAIAMALDPDLLIADEATTALDPTTQHDVIELLLDLRQRLGLAVLFVSHDLAAVTEMCDDVAVFYAGEIVERSAASDLLTRPLHPYAEALLSVAAGGSGGARSLEVIPGNPPQLGERHQGCRFAPRCTHAIDLCRQQPIELTQPEPDRIVRCIRADELRLPGVGELLR